MIELYYETEWYVAPPELKPALKNQAQRFPARGVNVRRLDHLNCLAADIRANRLFFEEYLGCRLTEQIVMNDGTEAGMWMTLTNKSYDFAFTRDHTGAKDDSTISPMPSTAARRSCGQPTSSLRTASPSGSGPHKHAVQQTFFLYVYEPGGNRVEVSCRRPPHPCS